jgi:hypothetical protein
MAQASHFDRVVVGLQHDTPRHGMQVAAEVAALLGAELSGFFVKEDELAGLAALPFAREFRRLEGGWRSLDLDALSRELDAVAGSAQRSFGDIARALGLVGSFDVTQGSMAGTIAARSRAGDIVVLPAPAGPAAPEASRYRAARAAALRSAAAVMLVPQRLARATGTIVAVTARPDDPSEGAAATFAALAKEELCIIEAIAGSAAAPSAVVPAGGRARRLSIGGRELAKPQVVAEAFAPLRERMVVITHDALAEAVAETIVAVRGVPVLLIEPAER